MPEQAVQDRSDERRQCACDYLYLTTCTRLYSLVIVTRHWLIVASRADSRRYFLYSSFDLKTYSAYSRRMSSLPPYGTLVDERPGARSCAGECQVSSLGYAALWYEDRVFTTGRDAGHIHRLIDGSEHLHPDCSPIKPRHVEQSRTAGVQRRLHCPLSLRCADRYLAVGIPAPPSRHRPGLAT